MKTLKWWMRIVGSFYILLFILASILQIPPKAILSGGGIEFQNTNFTHRLLVDTWVMFGLELGVIGAALWFASRNPVQHRFFVKVVIGLEVVRGIIDDIYMLIRGYDPVFYIGWIVVHTIIIVWALIGLRKTKNQSAT